VPQPSPPQAPAHWSEDFVEHLRTVHLTLVAVSIALAIVTISAKPYNPAVASRELHEILQLRKIWSIEWIKLNTHWVGSTFDQPLRKPYVYTTIQPNAKRIVARLVGTSDPDAKLDTRTSPPEEPVFVVFPEKNYIEAGFRFVHPDSFPSSLGNFENWWNELSYPRDFLFPSMISCDRYDEKNPGHWGIARINDIYYPPTDGDPKTKVETTLVKSAQNFAYEGVLTNALKIRFYFTSEY
jgi:hypothetical protein